MSGGRRAARFTLTFDFNVAGDLVVLYETAPALLDAAEAILDDLAYGRVRGRLLGSRHVSGDLSGLARVKFDVAGQHPPRFRVVYRQQDEATRYILAIGRRDEHAIYRTAVQRLAPSEED